MIQVLVVDDEVQICSIIAYALEQEGYLVRCSHSAGEAWHLFQSTHFDLVILDLMLPDTSGIRLCERIRAISTVPIMMLTALGELSQRLEGLQSGADDYLAKPFSPKEMVLRAGALTRRALGEIPESLSYGPLLLKEQKLYCRGINLNCSQTELAFMKLLLQEPERVFSLREILNLVWNTVATSGGRDMVKTSVYRLRKKFRDHLEIDPIIALRGRGYVLNPDLQDYTDQGANSREEIQKNPEN